MIDVLQQIKQGRVTAMKSGDKAASALLAMLYSDIENVGKNDGNRMTTDSEANVVLVKTLKNLHTLFESANGLKDETKRQEVTAKTTKEISIVKQYTRPDLSPEHLEKEINVFIQRQSLSGKKDIGKVMVYLKENFGGQYNPRDTNQLVVKLLFASI